MNLLTVDSWSSKRQLPSPFYCSPHPFNVISHLTSPPRLLWPLPLFYIYLEAQPPLPHHSYLLYPPLRPWNSAHESILARFTQKSRGLKKVSEISGSIKSSDGSELLSLPKTAGCQLYQETINFLHGTWDGWLIQIREVRPHLDITQSKL